MDDIISHLRHYEVFSGLDDDSLRAIAVSCRRRKFPPRTTLFLQDDPGQTMYIVVSGTVMIQTATASGEIVHVRQCAAGQVFGEFAILDGKPRSADAITGTQPSEMIMIDREPFLRVMGEQPVIALNIIAMLLDRLRGITLDITAAQKQDVMGRLAIFLLQMTRAIGKKGADGAILVNLNMTQQEMAHRINASRETVTRSLGRLEQMNIIERKSGVVIVRDPGKLQRLITI